MKILITAGAVYGRLDDNKLVSNRSRGIWAMAYAEHLVEQGHEVHLLVPDTLVLPDSMAQVQCNVLRHAGFADYRRVCNIVAPKVDAAVMAAAVVNWIPADPIVGKMATKGFKPGDIQQIPFVLAPHVIDEMKKLNPNLTLIGCKMTSGANLDDLVEAAYETLLRAHCNVVVGNDLRGLKQKFLVYCDRTVQAFQVYDPAFFATLDAVLADEHYHTRGFPALNVGAPAIFDRIVDKYRAKFVQKSGRVFGAVCVPLGPQITSTCWVSPREKGQAFTSEDAVKIDDIAHRMISAVGPAKPTLNAPLLCRVAQKYGKPVLHLHEFAAGAPYVPYAPPGTVRDNDRAIPGPVFNIEGHGMIAALDWKTLEISYGNG